MGHIQMYNKGIIKIKITIHILIYLVLIDIKYNILLMNGILQ